MGLLDAPAILDSRGAAAYSLKANTVLQPFRAALAGRAQAPVNIAAVGDSTEEGTGVGTTAATRNLSWPDKLAQLLRYRFPTPGETQRPVAPNYVPVYTVSTVATGWTINTGWALQQQFGPSATSAKCNTAGSTIVYTSPVGVTSLDLRIVAGTSITGLQYSIDGAANSATFGTTGANRETVLRLTGWTTTATHTLTITGMGNNSFVDGVLLYSGNESGGIRVFNCGHHGSRAPQYLNGATNGFANWITASANPSGLSGAQSMANLNPDLVFLALGTTTSTTRQWASAPPRSALPSPRSQLRYVPCCPRRPSRSSISTSGHLARHGSRERQNLGRTTSP
jgi:hypothetical protein